MPEPTTPPGLSFDSVPPGFTTWARSTVVTTSYAEARDRLVSWRMHERSGFRVTASGPPAAGVDVVLRSRSLGVPVVAPCRVLVVDDGSTAYRMVYATLPGHPLCGIEEFRLEKDGDGTRASLRAVSRPASALARLAPWAVAREQARIADRYLAALA